MLVVTLVVCVLRLEVMWSIGLLRGVGSGGWSSVCARVLPWSWCRMLVRSGQRFLLLLCLRLGVECLRSLLGFSMSSGIISRNAKVEEVGGRAYAGSASGLKFLL